MITALNQVILHRERERGHVAIERDSEKVRREREGVMFPSKRERLRERSGERERLRE